MSQAAEQQNPPLPDQPRPTGPALPVKGNALAVTALIIAIISLLLCLIPIVNNAVFFLGLISLVLGVVGVALSRGGRRRGKGMSIVAIVLSVLALAGVLGSQAFYGKALDDVGKAIDPDTTTSKVEPGGAASGSAPDQSAGPKTYQVGDTAEVQQNEEPAARITVSKATSSSKGFDSYADKPQNGRYKHVTIAIKNVGSEGFDYNPFDWYVRDADGSKYQYADGNYSGWKGKDLSSGTLAAGEKVQGTVEFDAPSAAKQLVYAPGGGGDIAAIWTIS
ncbi:DUF4352 domain-containing protein [Microlunatus flavus]|uniref:DUF4352 domain-containing protein n=1 Tax=Microlunatus flavus TaxID=1036181 RepID=A0A1H9NRX4_9ACTN|nr:DUF4352 domain-containing protein [Microlunatus flavus]SER38720.1 protein of unknown function [Microlunatus flavus]